MRFLSSTIRPSIPGALLFLLTASVASADVFQFSATSVSNTRTEGGASLTLTIERSGGSSGNATISYSTSGTASGGTDFTITPASSVAFSTGVLSQTISITFPEDSVQELTETLIVTLTGSNRGSDSIGTNNTATVNILDNDGPDIEINNVALTEGNSGTVVMAFTVQLSEVSTQNVSVNFATQNDTAIAGTDYTATSGMLTIPAGDQFGIINVSIQSNTVDQIDRSFFVNLSGAVNGNILDGQGVGTILDDDGPTVSVGDASVTEGNSGTVNLNFNVSLSAASPQQITVNYVTVDDSANAASDYSFRTGMLTFAPGVTSLPVSVPVIGDTVVEPNEQFFVDLFMITEAFAGDVQGAGTITNDDVAGVTVTAAPGLETTEAGGTATFTVVLSSTPSSDVVISLTSSDLTEGTVSPVSLTFTPGNALTPQLVTVTGVNDAIRDGDIAYTIVTGDAVSSDANYSGRVIADVAVTNLDDETDPAVTLSLTGSPMPENGGTATVTATLSHESTSAVTVSLGFTGTGTFNADYGVSSSSIVIPAGSLSGSITISAIDDPLDEPDETVIVDVTGVTNGLETVQQQVIAEIIDDDGPPTVQFLLADSSGAESVTPAQLAVTLSGASGRTVTVNYSVTGGSATNGGVDYTLASGTLTFNPGVLSQNVSITVVDDGIDEAPETIEVTLASPSNATLGSPALHTYTITDNDAESAVGFALTSSSGDEGTTPGQLTVQLSAASGQTVTVNYNVTGGTATGGGVDYTLASGTLTFTPGQTNQTIDIIIVDDLIDEVDETIQVTLSGPTNATLGTAVHTYTILDNDNAPTLSINDVTVNEGDSAVFTVTLTGATAQAVAVNFATADGTAVVVGDYVSNGGTLNFPAGTMSQTITVVTVEDGVNEASENFLVNLSVPVNATISDNQGVGTITDDDAAPTLSIDDVTVNEGDSAVFTVTLTGATAQAVAVNFATADGTAVVVGDYVSNSGTLSFPVGTTSQTITVVTVEDGVNEASETFFVNLTVPVNATVSDPQGVGTITDDDAAPALSIDDVTVTEGDSAVFTVTLTGATAQAVAVNFATADGTAVVVGDYVLNSGTLNFTAGTTSQTITVVTVEDGVNEASENFFVNLSVPVNASISDAQGAGTITDDDAAPTLSIDDVTVNEGDSAVFTVTLTGATAQAVAVNFATADGTAVVVGDYVSNSGTLNFPAGTTSQTITVVTVEDGINEASENFVVNLSGEVNATVSDAQGVGTITDDDAAPALSIDDVTVAEGDSAVFTVTLTGATAQAVAVNFATADGTAVVVGDYASNSGTLNFPVGTTSQTITVVTVEDGVNEASENYFVNLNVPVNATISDGQGVGTITDDDAAPMLSIDDVTVNEGDSAVFTVTLTGATAQAVAVNFATADGTAVVVGDYVLNSGTLNFPAGTTSQTITVVTVEDGVNEASENFFVNLSVPVNASISDAQGAGTITDDDAAPTLSIDDVTVNEGDSAVFTVTLTGATAQAVAVNFATADGTAVVVGDYVANSGTLNFPVGTTTQTITVETVEDGVNEASENFLVNLTVPVNATISDAQGVGTITDDDAAPALSIDDVTVTEGDSAVFTVTLTGATAQAVAVNFATADGTAVVVGDYASNSGTLNFPVGTTTQTITVVTVEDAVNEASENFLVNLSVPVNATISDAQGVGTITDDDAAPALSIEDVTVSEGDSAVFTVTLTGATAQAVAVNFATADGTAVVVGDYVANSGTLNFPAGTTSQTITVVTVEDAVNEPSENFFVNLSVPVNATISDAQGLGTITDDDAAPALSIDDVTVAEGDSAVFTVTLTGATAQAVAVNFSTADGTAVVVGDYVSNSGTLNFPAGTTTQTITVVTVEDGVNEASENFFVNLSGEVNATVSDAQGVGTITDDDAAPTLSVDDVTVTEGDSAVFTVTLTGATAQAVAVNFATADGTAVVVGDYVANSGTLNFPVGTTSQTITVVTVEDGVNEASENYFVNLNGEINATVSDPQGRGTITDDDNAPTVALSISGSPLAEDGGVATVTATLSAASGLDVTVNLSLSGTASGADYSASAGSISIPAGSLSGSITLTGTADAIDEADETIVVDIDTVSNAAESGTQQVTAIITDEDSAPPVTLSLSGSPLAEDGGVATVTATLGAVSGLDVTVNLALSGTASGADYSASGVSISIPAGSLSGSITLTGAADAIDEADETIIVDIASVTNGTESGTQQVTAVIADEDGAPAVTIGLSGSPLAEDGGVATLTATLGAVSGLDVTVNLAFTGTASGSDYSASGVSISIPAGSLAGSITLTGIADALDEADETIIVDISSVTNGAESGAQQVTATITDEDGTPTVGLSSSGSPLAEDGGVATVTATLSAASGLDVTVNLALSGTASGADYNASSGSIVIPAGNLTGSITLTGVADAIDEADETIVVDIDTVSNATESGTQQVTAIITDEDSAPPVTLSLSGSPLAEDGGVATVTAALGAVSGLDVTVNLALSGTASGADYSASGVSISIPAGSLSGSITLTGAADAIDEADETIVVDISTVSNATESGTQQVTATITDNDDAPIVTLSLAGSPVAEAGGIATVTATLSGISSFDVTVNLALSGSALLDTDYGVSAQLITITAGNLSGSATITAIQDGISEGDETVVVDIDSVVNASESVLQQVTATITDDDAVPSLSMGTGNLIEGDTGSAMMEFTVTLSGESASEVTVDYATADVTAAAAEDYTAVSTSLSIPAGSLSGTINIPVLGDELDESDETFQVVLSNPANATVLAGTGTGTITDDDSAPVAENDAYSTDEDVTLTVPAGGVLGNDSDADVDPITAAIGTLPANGSLTLNADGSFEYIPDENFNGTDSFTYTVTDGFNQSAPAMVTITVDAMNDLPVAEADAYSVNEDEVLTVAAPGVQDNDSDADSDPLTVAIQTAPDASEATVVLNADGSFELTPAENFNGTVTFTYVANDGTGGSSPATVTVTVNPVNDAPTATDAAVTTDEDTPVSTDVMPNVSDVDGDPLTVTASTNGTNGTVSCTAAGVCTYTPDANFNGTDSYTYTVDDGNGGIVTGTVNVTINPVNDAPTAVADSYSTMENVELTVPAAGVLANDTDIDGDSLTAVKVTDPANGTVTVNPDGSLVYTPNPNFFGSDSFTYRVNDGSSDSASVSVSITVTDAQDDPTLTSLPPGSICEGGPEFTLTVTGENFVNGSVIEWNGSVRTTTFVSATQLTALIPANDIASARTVPITVTNPLGGGTTNVMMFTVTEDTVAPTVTAPAEIVILQTECQAGEGGITATSSPELAAFLTGATAADSCSTTVDQLAPQFERQDVDSTTFLGGGNNVITFRFVDGAGNIGTADANVRVVLYGDLNEDGSVDAVDLVIMANHLVGNIPMGTAPFTAPMELVDLDRNSSLDAVDLVTTAHYLVGNISCLPYASGQ